MPQKRGQSRLFAAPTVKRPSLARKAWYGALRRWAVPSRRGICPVYQYSVASHAESASPASKSEVSTSCPRPVTRRARSAQRIPNTPKRPAPRSVIGTPTFTGGPSGLPVALMMPLMPCAIRS